MWGVPRKRPLLQEWTGSRDVEVYARSEKSGVEGPLQPETKSERLGWGQGGCQSHWGPLGKGAGKFETSLGYPVSSRPA